MLRRGLVASSVAILVLLIAVPAGAHVTIQPSTATQGGFATEFIQVPNERDDAQTVSVEVAFPTDHPLAFVSVQPVPGWTIDVKKKTLDKPIEAFGEQITEVVDSITWSGGSIAAGQFQRFPISIGPLPKADSLEFKAVQTYSDGEVVRWIEPTPASGEEPEHPAPVLTLTKESASGGSTTVAKSTTVVVPKNVATSDDVDSAKTVGYIAIGVAALGVILAIVALVRKRPAT